MTGPDLQLARTFPCRGSQIEEWAYADGTVAGYCLAGDDGDSLYETPEDAAEATSLPALEDRDEPALVPLEGPISGLESAGPATFEEEAEPADLAVLELEQEDVLEPTEEAAPAKFEPVAP